MHRDQLRIESPCHADWGTMTGDDRRRFCGACTKHVHDLSAMTERQARRITAQRDVCVRYATDARGRVLHAPGRAARVLALGAALIAAPAFASTAPAEETGEEGLVERLVRYLQERLFGESETPPPQVETPPEPEHVIMGRMVAPPRLLEPIAIEGTPSAK